MIQADGAKVEISGAEDEIIEDIVNVMICIAKRSRGFMNIPQIQEKVVEELAKRIKKK